MAPRYIPGIGWIDPDAPGGGAMPPGAPPRVVDIDGPAAITTQAAPTAAGPVGPVKFGPGAVVAPPPPPSSTPGAQSVEGIVGGIGGTTPAIRMQVGGGPNAVGAEPRPAPGRMVNPYDAPPTDAAPAPRTAPMQVRRIPGGPQVQGWTTSAREVPEEASALMDTAFGRRKKAIGDASIDRRYEADAAVEDAQADERAMAYYAEQRQKTRLRQENRYKEETAKLDRHIADAAATKIDPGRYLGGSFSGSRILAALAVGLGAIGSGLNGQPNLAAQIIDKNIDRDIEAQRSNLAAKRDTVAEQQGVLARMRDEFGDEDAAVLASKAQYLEMAKQRAAVRAAEAASAGEKRNAELLTADIEERQARVIAEWGQRTRNTTIANVPDRVMVTGGGPSAGGGRGIPKKLEGKVGAMADDMLKYDIPDAETRVTEYRAMIADAKARKLKEVPGLTPRKIAIARGSGVWEYVPQEVKDRLLTPEERRNITTAWHATNATLRKESGATYTEPEVTGALLTSVGSGSVAEIDHNQRRQERLLNARKKSIIQKHGGEPVYQYYRQDRAATAPKAED